jgi:PAS domain S-box-containing protein/hemerythrin-like metal-binding protein
MIINENILGVLEIASLLIFKDFEIEFIEKVAESIAASISSIRVNEQTSQLLEQSRKQAEELGREQNERQQIIKELQEAQEKAVFRERELKKTLEDIESKNADLKEKDLILVTKINDATENYKYLLNSLEKQQQLQSAIFERALDGVLIINGQGVITYFNPVCERIWGYSKDEVIGEKVNKLMPEPHKKEHDLYMDSYMRTGVKKIIGTGRSVEIITKNNEEKAIHLEVIDSSFDNEIYFTGFVKDLSIQKDLESQIASIKKNSAKAELNYNKYIAVLQNIIETNNIDIPVFEEGGHQIIEKFDSLMLNSVKLDPQRKQILEQINLAYTLMNNEQMAQSIETFNSLIKEFKDYFKTEEDLITSNNYENTKEHKKYHKRITIKILEYKEVVKKDSIESIYGFFEELKSLVVEHFANEDKDIVEFVN